MVLNGSSKPIISNVSGLLTTEFDHPGFQTQSPIKMVPSF